jgi:hypothetical protein
MTWKNWGDHPVIVGIGIIGILSGLGYTIYDHHVKQEDAAKGGVVSPQPTNSPVSTPSPSNSPLISSPSEPTKPVPEKPLPPKTDVTTTSPSPDIKSSSSPARAIPIKAEINQPLDASLVERNTRASGTLSDLAAEDSLWIYVYASGEKRYYPSKVEYNPDTKVWQHSLIIGSVGKEESGASFMIGLFIANAQMSKDLAKWGESGTSKLPEGIVQLQTVTVRRK